MDTSSLMEQILSSDNLNRAYLQVVRNKGAEGVDGMKYTELKEHLVKNGEIIKEDDIYSIDFMKDCYRKGKEDAKLNSHFGTDDHHIYDQIQEVLVQVITIVMNYRDEEDAK